MRLLKLYTLALTVCSVISSLNAQQLDENSKIKLVLSGGVEVYLLKEMSVQEANYTYYYLPSNLRVSERENKPEISLTIYDGGGILHFLLTWGLNNTQEKEAVKLLKEKINANAIIAGQVLVNEGNGFTITSEKPVARILRKSLNQNSHIPLIAGTKFAASFKLTADEVKEILEAKKDYNKLKDITIRMNFTYNTIIRQGFVKTSKAQEWNIELAAKEIFKFF